MHFVIHKEAYSSNTILHKFFSMLLCRGDVPSQDSIQLDHRGKSSSSIDITHISRLQNGSQRLSTDLKGRYITFSNANASPNHGIHDAALPFTKHDMLHASIGSDVSESHYEETWNPPEQPNRSTWPLIDELARKNESGHSVHSPSMVTLPGKKQGLILDNSELNCP
ncbi:uncharacterized protein LOC122570134 [Bombus pyrosoma]|uniref:uncharacterized protein LOC122570134 n=1 Tax=Bombus pyrosoma TaxID=396416 RepID=UPI001CB8B14C|nr:uncharacterized protein LOC122570134 [Bombus pyrosoma]